MGLITGTFTSYQAIGNREDLTDAIYLISPTDTPFSSMIPRNQAKARQHDWQKDNLRNTDTDNARLEGGEVTVTARNPTTRPINACQISDETASVSHTQEVVDKAGRTSEMAFQMDKATSELRRDMEAILLANQARNDGSDTVARRLASINSWLATNTNRDAGGADPAGDGTNTATDSAGLRAITEAMVKDVLVKQWNQGGKPSVLMCGGTNKQTISGFAGRASSRQNVSADTILAAADMYASDFGDLRVIPNRFQRQREVFSLDTEMVALSFLVQFRSYELAKIGRAERRVIESEYTLEMRNEAAHGIVADLTS